MEFRIVVDAFGGEAFGEGEPQPIESIVAASHFLIRFGGPEEDVDVVRSKRAGLPKVREGKLLVA